MAPALAIRPNLFSNFQWILRQSSKFGALLNWTFSFSSPRINLC